MHFRNPVYPRKLVNMEDLERVAAHLTSKHQFVFHTIKQSAPGTVQMNLGIHKGSGNIQLFTSKLGRIEGNARIAIGSSAALKAIRAGLLKSPWFVDAEVAPGVDKVPGNERGQPDVVFQPDGSILLPALSADKTENKELNGIVKKIALKLGDQGKKVMKAYMKECGVTDKNAVSEAVKNILQQLKEKKED